MIYKELQKKTYPSLRPKMFTPVNQHIQTSNIQQGVTYAQITKPKSFAPRLHPLSLLTNPVITRLLCSFLLYNTINKVMTFMSSKP
jgi:hypothetical protein